MKDGAFCVDGETSFIVSDSFFIELSTRNADKHGGGRHNASAGGEEVFLAIKCSEDSCATDGRGKKKLKVFPGTKMPTNHGPSEACKYVVKILASCSFYAEYDL